MLPLSATAVHPFTHVKGLGVNPLTPVIHLFSLTAIFLVRLLLYHVAVHAAAAIAASDVCSRRRRHAESK